jgi:hypothetical protein
MSQFFWQKPPDGSVFDPLSKALVILSHPQDGVSGFQIIQFFCENARFVRASAPMGGVVNEGFARHARLPIRCKFATAEQKIPSAM